MLSMVLLLILGLPVALVYAMVRSAKKWGTGSLWFFAAGFSLLDGFGALAERLVRPQWAWNFAHHPPGSAWTTLTLGFCYLCFGFCYSGSQRRQS